MFAFRSLTLGLLGACFMLLMSRPAVPVVRMPAATPSVKLPTTTGPTIIDVAPGVSASGLAALVRLGAGERITSIYDTPVSGDLEAGVALASLDLRSRRFVDVGVSGPSGERRVLVLLH